MGADASFFNQPRPEWFYEAPDSHDDLRAAHRQMRRICRNSLACLQRMEYEPAWNDLVHSRVLEEALDSFDIVGFRNVTPCRTLKKFHDEDPALRDNKVDYGIFLQPDPGDGLADLLANLRGESVDITHFPLSDLSPTPLAISIETKTLLANPIEGSVQLANWVRAHFRQLSKLLERRGHDPANFSLPVLPIIYVCGSTWRVDFAQRHDRKTMIYEGFVVGDTQTVFGCYQVCAAIRRLATWVQTDFRAWWLGAATLPGR